ncbi:MULTISPECIES: hypothetical protein [unclassified Curtobacterium]
MPAYRSPSGEVLDIPDGGTAAIEALGWEPVEAKPAPIKRGRPPKKTDES